ncbi:hypothetical protein [Candidatus Nardonella dryophthoridicola]|uniref:Uncharacterized protein n=1 Tax=endosymbiont of Metamasius hemipterus TaxID=204627 RepID=A0ABT0TW78_9GAMM|nr:hypothetical protein [Candidatus Nardonella dryophthoridicola]MCM0158245.1 hypothetical protein [endosymbiont of Metamasius hemipterus]
MSRIGKKPILIPNNFNINLNFNILNLEFNNKIIFIKLNINYINILINNNYLFININNIKNKKIYKLANAYYGTIRSIINNSIIGLINNFKKKLY